MIKSVEKVGETLQVEAVHKKFGPKSIFENISFSARSGEALAIMGPNGAGKTTLLRILATLIEPNHGSLSYRGLNWRKHSKALRGLISFMPARENHFFPILTGRENLEFFCRLNGYTRSETAAKLEWLSKLNPRISPVLETPYHMCSSGMRQILSFGRTLIEEAEINLLDEPTRSLDSEIAELLMSQFLRRRKDSITIFVTHDESQARRITGRVYRLENGTLVQYS